MGGSGSVGGSGMGGGGCKIRGRVEGGATVLLGFSFYYFVLGSVRLVSCFCFSARLRALSVVGTGCSVLGAQCLILLVDLVSVSFRSFVRSFVHLFSHRQCVYCPLGYIYFNPHPRLSSSLSGSYSNFKSLYSFAF